MNFKYFDRPELYASYTDEDTSCEMCGKLTKCFDATLFFGTAELEAICPQCLAQGKLYDMDVFTCEGDIEELEKQLKALHPDVEETAIRKLSEEKTKELEKTTPHLITWQDWPWPCADGDYCRFIGYGSKQFYHKHSNGVAAEQVFENSLYHFVKDIKEAEELWEELNEEEIRNYDQSADYSTLFYVFKSIHSNTIITVWDTN
jgi:uncharacterized protein CbrC (UPF0167 family)